MEMDEGDTVLAWQGDVGEDELGAQGENGVLRGVLVLGVV